MQQLTLGRDGDPADCHISSALDRPGWIVGEFSSRALNQSYGDGAALSELGPVYPFCPGFGFGIGGFGCGGVWTGGGGTLTMPTGWPGLTLVAACAANGTLIANATVSAMLLMTERFFMMASLRE
jgi:hypothetical protein